MRPPSGRTRPAAIPNHQEAITVFRNAEIQKRTAPKPPAYTPRVPAQAHDCTTAQNMLCSASKRGRK